MAEFFAIGMHVVLYRNRTGSSFVTAQVCRRNIPADNGLASFAPIDAQEIRYEVTRLDTGLVATGTLTGSVGTQLPAVTTLL